MAVGKNLTKAVKVKFLGDAHGFNAAAKEVVGGSSRIGKASEHFERLGKSAEGLAILGVSLEGMREKFTGSIEAATDLGEQVNKTGQVFGPSSKEILAWSKTTAKSLGIGRTEALETAGVFGNMLVPMGLARGKAADMSRGLVNLASDMASFNNADPSEVLESLRSGLAGESEPLRKFGVFLSQDRIEAEALSMGLAKTNKDLTKIKAANLAVSKAQDAHTKAVAEYGPKSREAQEAQIKLEVATNRLTKAMAGTKPKLDAQQKALATYSLIMKDTKDAQGDFARTSGSLANKSRQLHAEFANLQIELGKVLLPVVTRGAVLLATFSGFAEDNATTIKILGAVLGGTAIVLFTYTKAVKLAGTTVDFAKDVHKLATKTIALFTTSTEASTVATEEQTVAQRGLNLAMLANPITIVVAALVALGAAFYIAWTKSETFRRIVTTAWNDVKGAVTSVLHFFTETIPNAFSGVLNWARAHWPIIATIISGPFAPLVALATNAFGIRDKFEGAIRGIKSFVGDRVDEVVGFFRGMPDRLANALEVLAKTFIAPFKAAFLGAAHFIRDEVIGHGGKGATGIVGFFYKLPGEIASAIGEGAGALKDAVVHLFSALPGWAKKILGISSPSKVFKEIGKNVVQGFIHGIEHLGPALLDKAKGMAMSVLHSAGGAVKAAGGFIGHVLGIGGGGHRGGTPIAPGGAGGNVLLGKQMAAAYGWTGAEWDALYALWNQESGWNAFAVNPSSGAYGIPQSLGHGHPYDLGDAAAQIAWGLRYIKARYGDPLNAWGGYWARGGWYKDGGVFSRPTVIGVGEAGPEAVVPLDKGLRLAGGGSGELHVHFHGGTFIGSDPERVARELTPHLRKQLYRDQSRNVTIGLNR